MVVSYTLWHILVSGAEAEGWKRGEAQVKFDEVLSTSNINLYATKDCLVSGEGNWREDGALMEDKVGDGKTGSLMKFYQLLLLLCMQEKTARLVERQ